MGAAQTIKSLLKPPGQWRRRVEWWDEHLPRVALGTDIPKVLRQTYAGSELPAFLQSDVGTFAADNTGWERIFYNDEQADRFVAERYGAAIAALYRSIRPEYGAARADLFRYLLIYKLGGVYLDIKSRFIKPISSVLRGDEHFILSQWRNGPGQPHQNSGLHPQLADVPGGEFQQWHVIAAAGHPFLRAVIAAVLANIEMYTPWESNVGRIGVLRLTGPIVYTRAIHPLVDRYPYTRISNETDLSLEYSFFNASKVFGRPHYSTLTDPLIDRGALSNVSGFLFKQALALKELARA